MTDRYGREIKVGDLVAVNFHGRSVIVARVIKLNPQTCQVALRHEPQYGYRKDYGNVVKLTTDGLDE